MSFNKHEINEAFKRFELQDMYMMCDRSRIIWSLKETATLSSMYLMPLMKPSIHHKEEEEGETQKTTKYKTDKDRWARFAICL